MAVHYSLQGLRDLGFRVAVTHLTHAAVSITEVDWTQPTAFVLGNENLGKLELLAHLLPVKYLQGCCSPPAPRFCCGGLTQGRTAGVSEEAVEHADLVIKVPMQPSFVDSYNVSVRSLATQYS